VSAPIGLTRAVFRTEVRALLRDRRAFLLAVVLPMVLFPLLFLGMERLESATKDSLRGRELDVTHDLRALAPDLAERVLVRLDAEGLLLETVPIELAATDEEARRAELSALLSSEAEGAPVLALVALPPGSEAAASLELAFFGSSSLANEAAQRVRAELQDLEDEVRLERLEALVGRDPGAPLAFAAEDVAPPEDSVGHRLGSLLPLILVLVLVSGGSFAALGAFAGEREEGTIETLLVQPVPSIAIATGKFWAVLATGVLSALGNGASFLACIALGFGESRGLGAELALGTNALRLALGLVLFLPTAVFLSAVLCFVSARAKSFREGQHYVFPILLLGALLAGISTQDRVSSNTLLALVPVTGPTLVLRDALAGALRPGPALAAILSSVLWSWLLLRNLARTLDAERLFRSGGSAEEMAARHVQSRAAIRWGLVSVFLVYVVGGRLQTAAPIPGLVATLWLLVPALAFLSARATARRSGESLGRTLGLGAPRPLDLLGALLLAPGLATLMPALFRWQTRVLPLPSSMESPELFQPFAELSPFVLVLLVAVSPGLCEELLFRGALLSGMKRDLSAWKTIGWQALLFGAVHASVYRFVPTGLLGGVLAAVALRSGRLWPAVVLHTAYNAMVVLEWNAADWWSDPVALGCAALGTAALCWRRRKT